MKRSSRSGPPAILAFLLAVALVLGAFYIWQGFQTFLRTGGLGVVESTQRAQQVNTATAQEVGRIATLPITLIPSATDPPPCQDFRVTAPAGIVRDGPSLQAAVNTQFVQGTIVCVLGREPGTEFYAIDVNPNTKHVDLGYMHESIIEAVNPTLTPSPTFTPSLTVSPPPTVTNTPLPIPTITPSPLPSYTRNPSFTNTPLPTLTPTPTPSVTPQEFQSA